jgi:ABC-2 type transport system permease protein
MNREFRFLLRDKSALLWLVIGFILSCVAVTLGLLEIDSQRNELATLQTFDNEDRAIVLSEQSDWGGAAYYTFHLTADAPSDFAFAALGQRGTSPWKHRVRMLALEGQIYETDAGNPDLALVGRFDFAFVATLLSPLLVILLLFDLRSGERTAGRLNLIEASAQDPKRVWRMRTGYRVGGLALVLLIPLWVGGFIANSGLLTLSVVSCAVVIYIAFWSWVSGRIARPNWTGSVNLTVLLGLWLVLCAIVPAGLNAGIERAVGLPDTGEILLTQRETVNDAWDLPKAATMEPFLERHPEWTDYASIEAGFEWKWYYAFQQVGDQRVEAQSLAYREGRAKRDQLAAWSSVISPATALQRFLERAANTDMRASLKYEEAIRNYHAQLRAWYYPKLFQNVDFDRVLTDELPDFTMGNAMRVEASP